MLSKLSATFSIAAVLMTAGLATRLNAEQVNCSFYSSNYNGRRTASGQIFSNGNLTAASRTLAFGTRVKLKNPKNGRSVTVRINDRGPFIKGRDISVTRAAAERLGMLGSGVAQLEMEEVK